MSLDCEHASVSDIRFLHEFFTRSASRRHEQTAIDIPPSDSRAARRRVTYEQLHRCSNALAWRIRSFVTDGCVVAILLSRDSEHLYAAQLAVLTAGAAYLCIDPTFPDEQLRHILEDSGSLLVLTDRPGFSRVASAGITLPCDDVKADIHGASPPAAPIPTTWLTPDSPAYMIYTSGTTGIPKGVLISHRSIVNLVQSDLSEFQLSVEDRVAQGSSAAYDSSVEEVWLALAAGATLVVMDDEAVRLGPDLVPWLRQEGITVLCPPPTLLRTMGCDNPEEALPALRLLYVGGEPLTRDVADRWSADRRMVNGYGPTECTVTALRAEILPGQPISIGTPVPGLQAWVLSDSLEQVAAGSPGELCIGGVGLALGYHARPELTAERFLIHPRYGRIYRTGDLVRRSPDGQFLFCGRIDTQFKLRGYRIELEAVESCLADCAGVREAACRVQGDDGDALLVAFIVPEDFTSAPSINDLKADLAQRLPAYMVPSVFSIRADLPRSVGGKLLRNAFTDIDPPELRAGRLIRPSNEVERRLADAVRKTLHLHGEVSIGDDFFTDLGGNSLHAALFVSRLREDSSLAALTVRDVYDSRTVMELGRKVTDQARVTDQEYIDAPRDSPALSSVGNPAAATVLQMLWLLLELLVAAPVAYLVIVNGLRWLSGAAGHLVLLPLLAFAGLAVYTPFAVLMAVLTKRALIGAYRPIRAPAWGSHYVRHWIVQHVAQLIPWSLLAGTEFQCMALRALGARIGRRAHIHRGVNLSQGGWDLLDIGDDVTIGQDAMVRLVELEDGCIVVGPVALGNRATMDVRAGVGPYTAIDQDSFLGPLSSLPSGGRIPRGERWDGIPAVRTGPAPAPTALPTTEKIMSPLIYGTVLSLAHCILWIVLWLPWAATAIGTFPTYRATFTDTGNWMLGTAGDWPALVAWVTLPLPLSVFLEALAARAMGRVPEGVISRWSPAYMRVWLKSGLVDSAGEWLSGSLFWPLWLRLAGMRVGRNCEISTIIDVVPEMVAIGATTFLADGIYLGGPSIHCGVVTLEKVILGQNTFLGNHVVVPCGQSLPDDILVGVCTVTDDREIRSGSSWFGLPTFELPRREVVEYDARLTLHPSSIRYLNRLFWETLRFSLPAVPMLVLLEWLRAASVAEPVIFAPLFFCFMLPVLTAASGAALCLGVLALKWVLLGKVRPGTHPLWSCWCSRWDFLYVAWRVWAGGILTMLEGTLILPAYLRGMGATLGKRVVLGAGFSQVVDPDMLIIDDGATVNAMFQAHTFEDRVLKIDTIHIGPHATLGPGTVPLYGADVGAGAYVAPHSVIMKRERLLPGLCYEGAPTGSHRRTDPRNAEMGNRNDHRTATEPCIAREELTDERAR